ncbi:MAG TPA: flagellar biosynthetic protein FliO [Acetobacteraceae bacterium]|jgi:flagellar protein FliO/FliZ|nr:flagellar biosynthetic protein FliO [Acetobacteraceae bacterium]
MFGNTTSILTAAGALAAVLALIWLAGRLARFGGIAQRPTGNRVLAVQDTLPLDQRRRLYLVSCDQRRVLLLVGGTQDVVIGWLDGEGPGP